MICPEENWESYHYYTDTGLVVIGFHTEINNIEQEKFPYCARVIIPIKHSLENGGPTSEYAEELWRLEDELVEFLGKHNSNCLLLGRLTHSGVRELVFQVGDWESFRPPVGLLMKSHPELEIDVSEHDGWDFFYESVWPSEDDWHAIYDRRVVDNLIKNGSDAEKIHELDFVFDGNKEQLEKLKQHLVSNGYINAKFSKNGNQLEITKKMILDLNNVQEESRSNRFLCSKYGAEFNGWGASITK